jgi:plastocyanin
MRRTAPLLVAVLVAVALVAGVAAGASSKKPVKISGSVNVQGSANASKTSGAALDVSLDNFFFSPTFVKAKPGDTITLNLSNDGGAPHTFTSDALGVSEQLSPGASGTLEITVPADGGAFRFYCEFHRSSGMQGALYTTKGAKAGDKPAAASTTPTPSTSGGSGTSNTGSSGGIYDY